MLHVYEEALKIENPRTIFEIELEESQYFKYMIMTLCIRGFRSCCPVIIVNDIHLKRKY